MHQFGQIALVLKSVTVFVLKEMHLRHRSESKIFLIVVAG